MSYDKTPTAFWSGYQFDGSYVSLRIVEDLGLTPADVAVDTGDWRRLADRVFAQIHARQIALPVANRSVAMVMDAPAEKSVFGQNQVIYKIEFFDAREGRTIYPTEL